MKRKLPKNVEEVRKRGKLVGYRARKMKDGTVIVGPLVTRIGDALPALYAKVEALAKTASPQGPSLSTSLRTLIEKRLDRERKASTNTIARQVLNRIEASSIATADPSDLTPEDILNERLRWNLPPATAHRYQREFEHMLKLLGFPVKAQKPTLREPEVRILTRAEQTELIERAVQPRTKLMLRILLTWGLRNGEVCGLMHEDRFEDGILLRRAVDALGRPYPMKTDESRGWLPFAGTDLESEIGSPKSGYVLATSNGTPMLPSNLRRMVKSVAEHTAYEGITPQELRHTAAVNLLRAGVDPATAASITRHSIDTLLKIYHRSTPDAKVEALEKLARYRGAA